MTFPTVSTSPTVSWNYPTEDMVEVRQTDKATIVRVNIQGRWFDGTSIRHKDDPFNPTVGYHLALSRALANAQKFYEKKANSVIKQVDNDKAQKELGKVYKVSINIDDQCQAITQQGKQCKFSADPRYGYCGHHS